MIFIRLDENVSYKIAEAAERVGIPSGVALETPFHRGETGVEDVPWIEAFAKRGGKKAVRCVFSGDGRIRYNEPERAACEANGLIVFFAPPPGWWRPLKRYGQAAYFIRWLPVLAEIAKACPAGAQYRLPGSFTPRADLKPLSKSAALWSKGRPRAPKVVAVPLLDRST